MNAPPTRRVLLVGVGGLGCPAAKILVRSGIAAITLLDDDVVDASNLHRQILFRPEDVGLPKVEVAAERLREEGRKVGNDISVLAIEGRLLPHDALELVGAHDLVLEGADNFATKFLAADACAIARKSLVQAGAVRWSGWAFASVPGETACLRCVFEDIPRDRVETCAEAGVVGPVVGLLGALEAALALRILRGDRTAAGVLHSYRGREASLRARAIRPRSGCPLCAGDIDDVRPERYTPPSCAA